MNDNQCLWVKGCAGLGNRLMTFAAAAEYAQRNGRHLVIDWSDGCYAAAGENAFPLFFESDMALSTLPCDITTMNCLPKVMQNWSNENWNLYDKFSIYYPTQLIARMATRAYYALLIRLFDRAPMSWGCKDDASMRVPFGSFLPDGVEADVVLYADFAPPFEAKTLREHLRLRPEIIQRIDAYMAEQHLGARTLGLHVRATDKTAGKKLHRCIKKLPAMMEKHNLDTLFLCTDNAEIETVIQQHLGSMVRICSYPKNLPTVHQGGIHHWAGAQNDRDVKIQMAMDSVMDMFLLSKMEWLFYQRGSTFSEISHIFHAEGDRCKAWQDYC